MRANSANWEVEPVQPVEKQTCTRVNILRIPLVSIHLLSSQVLLVRMTVLPLRVWT